MLAQAGPAWPRPTPGRRPSSWPRTPATRSRRGTARSTPSGSARARFDVDAEALRPYFELDRVLHDGVFHAAGLLYGLRFAERHDLPRYHPDVRIFDVHDDDGQLGLFVADLYARDSKRGGAWMNSFVSQSHLLGTRPVVLNTLNIARPADGEPTLLTRGQRAHPVPRVRPRAARAVLRRAVPDVRRHRGPAGLRRVPVAGQRDVAGRPADPGELRPAPRAPASRCRPSWCSGWTRHAGSARGSRPPSTWPRPCSTRPGTGWPPGTRCPTSTGSRPTLSPRPGWRCPARRRATAAPTSTTSSAAVTAPATTPTSGARCSTPTPCSGSPRTAA